MLSRISLISALAMVVPIVLVLIAVAVLGRSSTSSQVVSSSDVAPRPTMANAGRDAASAPVAGQPEATAAPVPRRSGPIAPDFDGGGTWINSRPLTLADLTSQGKVVLIDFWTYG